ncbi:MAG: TonB-dependent receptor [Proteobacteria bacterium]|nr:TonB-dependent receptor [Pseudomonadota bacterium]
MSKSILISSSLLSLWLLSPPAWAATSVETVVVTATRTEQPKQKTGASISVITAEDLKQRQTVTVSDALEQTPGLTVVRNGGLGQTTAIGIRGALAGQSLVLIDGVRINDPSGPDGPAVLGDVLVNNISRIEILRGPQSTLYGSDAIGGVVDIITQRGGENAFALQTSAEAGSFDTWHVNAAAHGSLDDFDYGVATNVFHSNGISAADSRNGNRETDGYGNVGLAANTRWSISDTVSLDLRSYYTRSHSDYDDNFLFVPPFTVADSHAYNTNMLLTGYAGLNFDLFGGVFHNRIAAIGTSSDRSFFDSIFDAIHKNFEDKGTAQRLEYQGIVELSPDNEITFGAETQRTSFTDDSFSSFFPATHDKGHTRIDGYYAQWQTTLFDQLTLTGGVRYDNDQSFGSHTSLKLAAAWQVRSGTTLRANYGDGFKAPTLFELFSEFSNPLTALRPEIAHGWEAGADQSLLDGRVLASLTYFERRTTDQIDFFSCFGVVSPACALRASVGGYYYNVGRARSRGFEFEVNARLSDALSLTGSYTNMTAKNLESGFDLARRPHILASANAIWKSPDAWSLGAGMTYVGARFDDSFGSTRLPSHTVFNVYGTYALNGQLELFGRIENAFDTRYEPVLGYGAPGRAVFAGIRAAY